MTKNRSQAGRDQRETTTKCVMLAALDPRPEKAQPWAKRQPSWTPYILVTAMAAFESLRGRYKGILTDSAMLF